MYNVTKVNDDVTYIGASDRKLSLFEAVYPLTNGVSYNSYLINDEKTVLLDTVDRSVSERFFENLAYALNGRTLDYVIVNHMEPDHAATLGEVVLRYPNVKIVTNAMVKNMIKQYFDFDVDSRVEIVADGGTFSSGKHTFAFATAPLVHWPEVMMTYDTTDKILYSADAFGTFGALAGNIFADEVDFEKVFIDDARRYYTNIVGKYGVQVQAALKKAGALDIKTICPLHGPIWRENLSWFIDKYDKWSRYEPEDNTVLIAYGSIYGGTENAANIVATELAKKGVKNIAMYDVSETHPSVIVTEAFRCSHIVLASSTYNMGIFTPMETAVMDLAAHNLQNRTVAIIENGTWAPVSGKLIKEIVEKMKGMTIIDNPVTIKSTVKEEQRESLVALADKIAESIGK